MGVSHKHHARLHRLHGHVKHHHGHVAKHMLKHTNRAHTTQVHHGGAAHLMDGAGRRKHAIKFRM